MYAWKKEVRTKCWNLALILRAIGFWDKKLLALVDEKV